VRSLEDFVDFIKDELGDVEQLVRDEQFIRWVNRGRARLGIVKAERAALTWAAGAAYVALPDDFERLDSVVPDPGVTMPRFFLVASTGDPAAPEAPYYLRFVDPSCVEAGTAAVYYGASYPDVTGAAPSTMPPLADEAAVSFALSRFFRRLAASRADFKRYATITGQSGIDVNDLTALADEHVREFEDARAELIGAEPATFYSD
jgi:hypothetical protein